MIEEYPVNWPKGKPHPFVHITFPDGKTVGPGTLHSIKGNVMNTFLDIFKRTKKVFGEHGCQKKLRQKYPLKLLKK